MVINPNQKERTKKQVFDPVQLETEKCSGSKKRMLSRLVVMLVMSASANGVMGTKLKSILGYRRRSSLFSLAVLFVRVWNRPIFLWR